MRWVIGLAALALACGDDSSSGVDAGEIDGGTDAGVDAAPEFDANVPESRPADAPLTQWVNPFIGTGGLGFGVGSAFPGPQTPFGLARPGPDTSAVDGAPGFNHCAGYYHLDNYIRGFSQVRPHGMGIPEYGVIAIMPTDGMSVEKTSMDGRRSLFSHEREVAEPGYYAVTLDDTNIRAELTASDHVAHHRYTFPDDADRVLIFDVGHTIGELTINAGEITVDAEAGEIVGVSQFSGGYSGRFGGMPVYFVARLDQPIEAAGTFRDGALEDATTQSGTAVGAWVRVPGDVHIQVGLSFTDLAHARANLEAQTGDFDDVRAATQARWEETLGRIEIEGRSEEDFTLFYSALYHALLMPTLASDVDGTYRGFDNEVHVAEGFRYFTDFSLWDTYRTQTPLLTLFYPELMREQLLSLLAMAREGGYFPRWPLGIGYTGGMVGDSANLVFADAYAKGLRDYDVAEAYALMRRTAFARPPDDAPYGGRRAIDQYLERGYVPIEDAGWSASATLEFAYDDWGLAMLADAAGESEDAAQLRERARNWQNAWDPDQGYLLGRSRDGSFPADVDPLRWQHFYAEGNVFQYLFFAPHDLDALAETMGGADTLVARLEDVMQNSTRRVMTALPSNYYWHGNEPDLHYAWIFANFDRPAQSARWIRWIVRTFYDNTPAGLPGNDDSGTLSSWLVFAQLGFYPITGAEHYLIAAPMVTRAVAHLPGGDLIIEAPNASDLRYEGTTSWEGTTLERARVSHAKLAAGGTLRFDIAE
ncbi:MAG: GH92 family glycosyl hydrolase [Myxococcota bacterium]